MERLKAHGFSADTYRRPRGAANDVAELAAWLKERPKPCGVFVAFDDRALDVMEACRMAEIREEMRLGKTMDWLIGIRPEAAK